MKDYFAGDTRTNRERMLAGDLYIADDPDSSRIARRAFKLTDEYYRREVDGDPQNEEWRYRRAELNSRCPG